jgi:hypothetical protein
MVEWKFYVHTSPNFSIHHKSLPPIYVHGMVSNLFFIIHLKYDYGI